MGTRNVTTINLFYNNLGNLPSGCLTVKNWWGLLTGDDGLIGHHSLYATLLKFSDVPEVLEVQVVPSEEVRIVPEFPTATKVPFP